MCRDAGRRRHPRARPDRHATQLGNVKRFSTALQLGERLALGTTFGSTDSYEIAAYVQHVSNGDIELPNSGLTAWGVTLRLPLD